MEKAKDYAKTPLVSRRVISEKLKEDHFGDPEVNYALDNVDVDWKKAAIEKAGTTDKEAVAKAIKELEFEGITGHLTFDEKNNPVKSITIIKIVNGDYTFDSVVSK